MASIIKVDQIQSDSGTVNVSSDIDVAGTGVIRGHGVADQFSLVGGVSGTSNRLQIRGASHPTTPNMLTIDLNGGETHRLNANGAIILKGGSTTIDGTGISFPASQNASSDANTLDDYEEGTWTPVNASIASLTFSVLQANYIKIGRVVHVQCYLNFPSTADTNQAKVGGLPFAAISAGSNGYAYLNGRISYSAGGHATWQVAPGLNECAGFISAGVGALNNNNLSGGYILLSGTYISNS